MLNFLLVVIGAVFGISLQLNLLAARPDEVISTEAVMARIVAGAVLGPLAVYLLRRLTAFVVRKAGVTSAFRERFLRWDVLSYSPFLLMALGSLGVRVAERLGVAILLAVVGLKAVAFALAAEKDRRAAFYSSQEWLAVLFFFSGFAALIYQIVWQRVLYSIYGINIESITIIVSIFMLGLGLGALCGGYLSKRFPGKLPLIFLAVEIAIGVFGAASLPLIKSVGALTLDSPPAVVNLMIFLLLIVPTMLMGATLPALVAYLYKHYRHVGQSVGTLYFINTLGSASACFVTAHLLFAFGGMQSAVLVAAAFNFGTGVLVYRYMRAIR